MPPNAGFLRRYAGFAQKASPFRRGKGAGDGNRRIMPDQSIGTKNFNGEFNEKVGQPMPVKVVNKPAANGVPLHPLQETYQFVVGQMMGKKGADDKIGFAVGGQGEKIHRFEMDARMDG